MGLCIRSLENTAIRTIGSTSRPSRSPNSAYTTPQKQTPGSAAVGTTYCRTLFSRHHGAVFLSRPVRKEGRRAELRERDGFGGASVRVRRGRPSRPYGVFVPHSTINEATPQTPSLSPAPSPHVLGHTPVFAPTRQPVFLGRWFHVRNNDRSHVYLRGILTLSVCRSRATAVVLSVYSPSVPRQWHCGTKPTEKRRCDKGTLAIGRATAKQLAEEG